MEREVTLLEMLQAREARAMAQQTIMEELGLPVISFCLNIAGPVKTALCCAGPSALGWRLWRMPWPGRASVSFSSTRWMRSPAVKPCGPCRVRDAG